MAKKEKIIFSQKCECRCKNAMTESDVLFKMRLCGKEDQYAFWCRGCMEDIYIHKEQLPHKVVKKLEKRFKKK